MAESQQSHYQWAGPVNWTTTTKKIHKDSDPIGSSKGISEKPDLKHKDAMSYYDTFHIWFILQNSAYLQF